jgi:hypothetical protein
MNAAHSMHSSEGHVTEQLQIFYKRKKDNQGITGIAYNLPPFPFSLPFSFVTNLAGTPVVL